MMTGHNEIIATKMLVSSSVFAPMVIFNDPAYLTIAIIGAFVSTVSRAYDVYMLREQCLAEGTECHFSMLHELFKATLVGALVTILLFMGLNQFGGQLISEYLGMKAVANMLPSFWFILSIALGTESVTLWDGFWKFIKRKGV